MAQQAVDYIPKIEEMNHLIGYGLNGIDPNTLCLFSNLDLYLHIEDCNGREVTENKCNVVEINFNKKIIEVIFGVGDIFPNISYIMNFDEILNIEYREGNSAHIYIQINDVLSSM